MLETLDHMCVPLLKLAHSYHQFTGVRISIQDEDIIAHCFNLNETVQKAHFTQQYKSNLNEF